MGGSAGSEFSKIRFWQFYSSFLGGEVKAAKGSILPDVLRQSLRVMNSRKRTRQNILPDFFSRQSTYSLYRGDKLLEWLCCSVSEHFTRYFETASKAEKLLEPIASAAGKCDESDEASAAGKCDTARGSNVSDFLFNLL